MKHIWQAVAKHRAWAPHPVWLLVGLAVLLGLGRMVSPRFIPAAQPRVEAFAQQIEALPPGSVVLWATDYGPAGQVELGPVAEVLLTVAMERQLNVIALSLVSDAPLLVEQAAQNVKERFADAMAQGFVHLGFREGGVGFIRQLNISFEHALGTAYRQARRRHPWLQKVQSIEDVDLLVSFSSGSPLSLGWLAVASERSRGRMVAATTSMVAPQYLPFWDGRTLHGLVVGAMDAAALEHRWSVGERSGHALGAHLALAVFLILAMLWEGIAQRIGSRRSAS